MTSSCKWRIALKYDLVLFIGWITNRCSGNEPALSRKRPRKSSLYYLLCDSNKRRLVHYFDRSIVYWPIILKFRKLKQTFVVFYRLIGFFFATHYHSKNISGVSVLWVSQKWCIVTLNKQKKSWFVVRTCQGRNPTPVGTMRADFSWCFFLLAWRDFYGVLVSGFRFKKKLSTFLRLSVTTGMRIDLKEKGFLLTV